VLSDEGRQGGEGAWHGAGRLPRDERVLNRTRKGHSGMSRYERWISASFATARFEQFMGSLVQGLGRLDISLGEGDQLFLANFEENKESVTEAMKLTDRFTLSHLWVLGAYELVRTICQRIAENRTAVPEEIARSFEELKREFTRLRVPLAKMESASAHKNTDSRIAYPALSPTRGIGWEVAQGVFISRQDLADHLLATLEDARSKDPKLTPPGSIGA
jgi:hypothetical protein